MFFHGAYARYRTVRTEEWSKMPVSKVLRRMGPRWPIIVRRVEELRRRMAPEGLMGDRFAREALSDVDPADLDEVLNLLHRRKLVFVSRNRGAVRVYGSKPGQPSKHGAKALEQPLAAFLGAVVSHMAEAGLQVSARSAGDQEAAERLRIAVGRVLALCYRHEGRGLSLGDMRGALWQTFADPVMKAVAFHEPRLQRESDAESFDRPKAKPGRIASGLSVDEKVFRLIEKAGKRGITATQLLDGIRPLMTADQISAIAGGLEASGMVVSGIMRVAAKGTPGRRYFTADIGLPYVRANGQAVFVE